MQGLRALIVPAECTLPRADEAKLVLPTAPRPHPQVLLSVPNLVCWLRGALLVAAIALGESRPLVAWWLAACSLGLDWLDGLLARRLGQVGA